MVFFYGLGAPTESLLGNLSSFSLPFRPKFLSFSHPIRMPLCFLILRCQSHCFPSSQHHGLLLFSFPPCALHLLLRVGYTAIILEYSRGSSSLFGTCLIKMLLGKPGSARVACRRSPPEGSPG